MPARVPRRTQSARPVSPANSASQSDSILLTAPLQTDLDQRILQEEDGHRLCMGNWNSYQITQLEHVVQPPDSVQGLSDYRLTLSKHFANWIDSIRAADSRWPTSASSPPLPRQIHSRSALYNASVSNLGRPPLPHPIFRCGIAGSCSWDLYTVEKTKTASHRHPLRY